MPRSKGLMKDLLDGGADLAGVDYSYNTAEQIQLERKESMKARGLPSPDAADRRLQGVA